MIVRNWMRPNPTTIEGGMLLAEAYRIFSDKSVRAMPVVEDGALRGLLTRAHCLRAVENIARTQDNHEFDYFTNKLKVKDIMVRSPATIEATDTMEYCMRVGQEDGNSQFPVLDNGKVVGIITATEIFSMAAQLIGAWDHCSGVTLQVVTDSPVDMKKVAIIVDEGGARLKSIYPLRMEGEKHRRIVVRFETENMDVMVKIFENEGFEVLEKKFRRKPVVKLNDS
jgi:acetoin utilization protein AcuB